jgi:hypothetical protein
MANRPAKKAAGEVEMQRAVTDHGDHGWDQVRGDVDSLIMNNLLASNA